MSRGQGTGWSNVSSEQPKWASSLSNFLIRDPWARRLSPPKTPWKVNRQEMDTHPSDSQFEQTGNSHCVLHLTIKSTFPLFWGAFCKIPDIPSRSEPLGGTELCSAGSSEGVPGGYACGFRPENRGGFTISSGKKHFMSSRETAATFPPSMTARCQSLRKKKGVGLRRWGLEVNKATGVAPMHTFTHTHTLTTLNCLGFCHSLSLFPWCLQGGSRPVRSRSQGGPEALSEGTCPTVPDLDEATIPREGSP